MRLLFVDDEPRILNGIENALIFANDDWSADFAGSGEEAVALLDTNPYDVLVTDMKMPGLTGADVLEHAMAVRPAMVRLILSGEVDPTLAERAMPLTHEFVPKPCDPDELFGIIERVTTTTQTLESSTVRDVLGSLDQLPSEPTLHLEIQEAIDRSDGSDVIGRIIERDLAISASVIKTANSAFYGFRNPAENVRDAVVRLGMQTVSGIVLNAEVASWASPEKRSLVTSLNAHSAMMSHLTQKLVGKEHKQAALCGLLHDVGVLMLITQFEDEFDTLERVIAAGQEPGEATEREIFGASHAEIGAYMLEMWKADPVVVEATRHHHDPDKVDGPARRLIDAITAADAAHDTDGEVPDFVDRELYDKALDLMADARSEMERA